jgi:hypothetical protein
MNDLRAIGGFAYFRSIIGIVLARPKHKNRVSKRRASRRTIASDSLVYNTPLFVSQFDRCFIVRVEIISAAAATKVADAE